MEEEKVCARAQPEKEEDYSSAGEAAPRKLRSYLRLCNLTGGLAMRRRSVL